MSKPKDIIIVGWMERISLPDLDLDNIPAKIDTGARTSALHATRIETFTRDGAAWVRFRVRHPGARSGVTHEQPIHERRDIKNTSGVPEDRIVIRTDLLIAGHRWRIDLSLTDRTNMRSPIIVGRTALSAHNVAVHTRRTRLKKDPTQAPTRRGKAIQ
ncbi:ATP-dependent zinc protease [Jannaschia sp. 2305UL9-9]|uniref:ATP-dependent zinc protease family protein n=1 Tax=Jannaschia sp. 2305UL9-9 TaxID=3121638 RepID=UPI0035285AC4